MISEKEFLNKVRNIVIPEMMEIEKERKKVSFIYWFFLVLSIVPFFIVDELVAKVILFSLLISVSACICDRFKKKYKKKFYPLIFSCLSLSYHEKNAIIEETLKKSDLFDRFDKLSCDDYFFGRFDNASFSVAEIRLSKKTRKEAEKKVFEGVCIDIPTDIFISGRTLLFSSETKKAFPSLERINLEDRSFSKSYRVFSDDQIKARVLLSPAFMNQLSILRYFLKNEKIDISFFENHVLFAIHSRRFYGSFFEIDWLLGSVTDIKQYEKFYRDIKLIYDITKIVKIANQNLLT